MFAVTEHAVLTPVTPHRAAALQLSHGAVPAADHVVPALHAVAAGAALHAVFVVTVHAVFTPFVVHLSQGVQGAVPAADHVVPAAHAVAAGVPPPVALPPLVDLLASGSRSFMQGSPLHMRSVTEQKSAMQLWLVAGVLLFLFLSAQFLSLLSDDVVTTPTPAAAVAHYGKGGRRGARQGGETSESS